MSYQHTRTHTRTHARTHTHYSTTYTQPLTGHIHTTKTNQMPPPPPPPPPHANNLDTVYILMTDLINVPGSNGLHLAVADVQSVSAGGIYAALAQS